MNELNELLAKLVGYREAYNKKIENLNHTIEEKYKTITWFEEEIQIRPLEKEIEKINIKLEVINSVIKDITQLKEENGIYEPEPTFITEPEDLGYGVGVGVGVGVGIGLGLPEEQEESAGAAETYEKSEE